MSRQTALHGEHVRANAVFGGEGGWEIPVRFGPARAEYERAVGQAVRIDLGHHGRVEVKGKEAASFLQNLCTNDIKGLGAGAGCEAFLCTNKAKVVAHVHVCRLPVEEPTFRLDAVAGQNEKILAHLDHYLISEQVELADITADWTQILVAGPEAAARAASLLGVKAPLPAWTMQPLENANAFLRWRDDLSVPALDIWTPVDRAGETWQRFGAAGVFPAGTEAFEALRLEAGTPRYGVDIDEQRFVVEVNRAAQAISYAKGCYLGQEPIVMARDRGQVNRLLLGLVAAGTEPFAGGAQVFREETEVGQVTSSAFSPRLDRTVALAYLRRGAWEPGMSVAVATPAGVREATVTSTPFIPPQSRS
ncbi:MAG: glycine cleavage T C-terminal barrel domain-containing protein [Gemmataceae bacterium]